MKKILLVINSGLANAGVPSVMMNIVSHLNDELHFDALVYSIDESYYDEKFRSFGGEIFRMDITKYKQHYLFKGIGVFFKTFKLLKNENYDIIHCNNGLESGLCVLAAKILGTKTRITHCHGSYKIRNGKNYPLRFYEWLCRKWIHGYSTDKITCSINAGSTLFGNDSEVINMLNPLDVHLYNNIEKKHNYNRTNILQIGYFCTNKNQLFSIEILRMLLDKGGNVHLYLIGYENEVGYLSKMKKLINELELVEFITFLPHDYDKRNIFSITDALILPSYSEGLPLVALESQVANVPCIASTNVPKDANVGLCSFIPLSNINCWVNELTEIKKQVHKLDNEKISRIDSNNYANIMLGIYQGN